MAALVVIGVFLSSGVVAVLGYFLYQELKEVAVKISPTIFIPAKRSSVFEVLTNPENFLKFHPLSVDIRNVVKSQNEEGYQTIQYDYTEHVVLWGGVYERDLTFTLMTTIIETDAVIKNQAEPSRGLKLNQRWLLTDSKEDDKNGTLLEDQFEITGPRILARIAIREGRIAQTTLLENLKQHFTLTKQE